tara:strand:- start:706 stop:1170 length:465 start_codon:yes stop_codon:yes gene_type:complete
MLYIGIDPGPKFCGLVVYRVEDDCSGVVIAARNNATIDQARAVIAELAADDPTVVIEHTHPGPPSWSVIKTTVVVGRLLEYSELRGLQTVPVHRKDVKAYLGKADSHIRRSLIEQHGLDPETYHYTQETALKGVTGHAWQALAAVITLHDERTS